MENEEDKKTANSGKQTYTFNLDNVPEPFRALVKEQIAANEAAKAGKDTPGATKLTLEKQLQFTLQGGAAMGVFPLLKLLLKAAQAVPPPAQGPAGPAVTTAQA